MAAFIQINGSWIAFTYFTPFESDFVNMTLGNYCYDQDLKDTTWSRAEGDDNTIGCAVVVLVSASYSRYFNLAFFSCTMTHLPHGLCTVSSLTTSIYSVDTILYPYTLPLISSSLLFFKSLSKYNLSSSLRS